MTPTSSLSPVSFGFQFAFIKNIENPNPYYERSSFFSPSLLLFSLSCPQLAPQLAKPPPPSPRATSPEMAGKCKGSFSTFRNVDGRIVTSADDECYQQFLFKNMLWCVLHTTDFSDGELKEELFCVPIASIEIPEYYLSC
ncbi:hypothetical protein C5167_044080 [Papaver somniferum]|uniref:Uncharacterized protein n=1 Tax=Papaver somniferum TaxID=3469 RepID=A0A4Y7LA36_PAPSO|nr:hypothetical protein C5167_044080 [Papaver somniferum]